MQTLCTFANSSDPRTFGAASNHYPKHQLTGLAAMLEVGMLTHSAACYGHGEAAIGIGGSTINTLGAEIPDASAWYYAVRYDRRRYRLFSDAQLLEFAARGEEAHQHAPEILCS